MFDIDAHTSPSARNLDQHPALSLNPSAKAFRFGGRSDDERKSKSAKKDEAEKKVEATSTTCVTPLKASMSIAAIPALNSEKEGDVNFSSVSAGSGWEWKTNKDRQLTPSKPIEEQQQSVLSATLLSPGEALPAACTKDAWAGLFGPIGAGASSRLQMRPLSLPPYSLGERVSNGSGSGHQTVTVKTRERVALFQRGG